MGAAGSRGGLPGRLAFLALVGTLVPAAEPAPPPAAADRVRDAQWHADQLDLATAHKITDGAGVTVAVIDSGVDAHHRDLRENLLPGVDLVEPGNPNAWTPEEHGTLVAGVLAGHGHGPDRADGVLGIAAGASLLPIRAATDTAQPPSPQLLAEGIHQAVALGAGVISISLSSEPSELDERAIEAARRADTVVVAAAGNRPDADGVAFPASLSTVVAVGGVDRTGGLAEFSVTGPEVALTAPGHEIVTTRPGNDYAVASGTSFAAPVVAGAAALIRAAYPDLSADEVIHRLLATADDRGPPGFDEQYGHGTLDLVAALTAEVPAMPPVSDQPDQVRRDQWHLGDLDVPAAHRISRGEDVTVALISSGVDASHPDLHQNTAPGVDLAEPTNERGWTPDPTGTGLAGIIAGHGNRLTDQEPGHRGVLGIAPAANLLPVRVSGPELTDEQASALAVAGLEWAVTQGADVICYAGGATSQDVFTEVIEAARDRDVLIVAAATGPEDSAEVWFPGAHPAVVTALGVNRDGAAAASFDLTDTGPALAAPGAGVLTTAPGGGYAEAGSTGAAAAAVVAGAAALVRAQYPRLTADEVVHRLASTARPAGGAEAIGAGAYGHGMLDPVAALTADLPPPTRPGLATDPTTAQPQAGRSRFGPPATAVLVAAGAATVLGATGLAAHRVRHRRSRRLTATGAGSDHEPTRS